jgi:hypothetical protein
MGLATIEIGYSVLGILAKAFRASLNSLVIVMVPKAIL